MISNAVSLFINSTDGVQNTEQFTSTGIGNAVIGNQLNVSLPVPTAGDAPTLANPTSQQTIHNELHRKHSTSSSKAKKVKKRKREPTPVLTEFCAADRIRIWRYASNWCWSYDEGSSGNNELIV